MKKTSFNYKMLLARRAFLRGEYRLALQAIDDVRRVIESKIREEEIKEVFASIRRAEKQDELLEIWKGAEISD